MGRGLLTFKGDAPKKKKSSSGISNSNSRKYSNTHTHGNTNKTISDDNDKQQQSESPIESSVSALPTSISTSLPVLTTGKGRVTTSGTVVTGHDTNFEQEFSAGDAMMIGTELRVVTMRLSNISCGISSAFSQNHSTPTTFAIIKKPKSKSTTKATTNVDATQNALASSSTLYREKTEHGSYRLIQMHEVDAATRSDLLHLRAKKTSDKYC